MCSRASFISSVHHGFDSADGVLTGMVASEALLIMSWKRMAALSRFAVVGQLCSVFHSSSVSREVDRRWMGNSGHCTFVQLCFLLSGGGEVFHRVGGDFEECDFMV